MRPQALSSSGIGQTCVTFLRSGRLEQGALSPLMVKHPAAYALLRFHTYCLSVVCLRSGWLLRSALVRLALCQFQRAVVVARSSPSVSAPAAASAFGPSSARRRARRACRRSSADGSLGRAGMGALLEARLLATSRQAKWVGSSAGCGRACSKRPLSHRIRVQAPVSMRTRAPLSEIGGLVPPATITGVSSVIHVSDSSPRPLQLPRLVPLLLSRLGFRNLDHLRRPEHALRATVGC